MARDLVVKIKAETSGFVNGLRKAQSGLAGLDRQTGKTSSSFGSLLKTAAASTAVLGVGKLIKDSVQLEAAYSKTMAQVAVATNAPKSSLKELDALAMKMGADTVFSAQDAGNAMLELAKGGLTTAQIQSGALADTLTLASAGGLELGDAAGTVVQAMGAFQLRADQTSTAVAALAGGANASAASVQDMSMALSQVGTGANAAGFSIQDTTAYLASFANQGFKGSDAGTALKTMLSRLVPTTKTAAAAMDALNLTYLDNNGNLVDAGEIAKRTQKAFKGLNDGDRQRYTNAIFGLDAIRGVNALTIDGEAGIRKYTKATSDLTQAQKLADAANSGTAGALEQFSGAVETAQIQIGKGLAPVIQDLANKGSDLASSGDFERWAREGSQALVDFGEEVAPLVSSLMDLGESALPAVETAGRTAAGALKVAADVVKPFVDAFNSLPDAAKQALILAAGAKTLSSRMGQIPGVSAVAGSNLVAFGGNARKAGDDAGKATPKLAGLLGSLKGFAVVAGLSYVLPNLAEGIDDGLHAYDASNKNFSKSFDEAGLANAKTVAAVGAAFQDGAIGKYADDLGVNLDALAQDFAKNGLEGDYVRQALAAMDSQYSKTKDALRDPFESIIGKGESDKIASVRNALEDLAVKYDAAAEKARAQALAVDKAKNAYTLVVNGLGAYTEKLKGLPTKAVTEISTPGAVTSAADVISLQKRFALTPDEVKTVMKALNLAKPVIDAVKQQLNSLPNSKTVTLTTIQRTIKESYTRKGSTGGNSPGVDAAFGDKNKKAAGGAIFGPGTGTSDSIPARLSNGEHVWTAREVAAAGGQRAMYAMRAAVTGKSPGYATGGAVTSAGGGQQVVSVKLKGARVAADKDGMLSFIDGRVEVALGSRDAKARTREMGA